MTDGPWRTSALKAPKEPRFGKLKNHDYIIDLQNELSDFSRINFVRSSYTGKSFRHFFFSKEVIKDNDLRLASLHTMPLYKTCPL